MNYFRFYLVLLGILLCAYPDAFSSEQLDRENNLDKIEQNAAMIQKLMKRIEELEKTVKILQDDDNAGIKYKEFTVRRIIDGDTIEVEDKNNVKVRVRLQNINTPEMGKIYSYEAKYFLNSCINNKVIKVKNAGEYDDHGRLLGTIYYNNENINERIVRAGWATTFMTSGDSISLFQAQEAAKHDKVGIWQEYDIPDNFKGVFVVLGGEKYHHRICWYIKDKNIIPIPYEELSKYNYQKCSRFK